MLWGSARIATAPTTAMQSLLQPRRKAARAASSADHRRVSAPVNFQSQRHCNHLEYLLNRLTIEGCRNRLLRQRRIGELQLDTIPTFQLPFYETERRVVEDQRTAGPGKLCVSNHVTLNAGLPVMGQ